MPWVDDRVWMPKYISILDLTNWGIWQEPLTKEDCPKTTSKELCNFSIFMGTGDIFTHVIRRIGSLANRKFSTTGMEYHVFTGEKAFRGLFNTVSCCWLLKTYISKSCLNGLFIAIVGYIGHIIKHTYFHSLYNSCTYHPHI